MQLSKNARIRQNVMSMNPNSKANHFGNPLVTYLREGNNGKNNGNSQPSPSSIRNVVRYVDVNNKRRISRTSSSSSCNNEDHHKNSIKRQSHHHQTAAALPLAPDYRSEADLSPRITDRRISWPSIADDDAPYDSTSSRRSSFKSPNNQARGGRQQARDSCHSSNGSPDNNKGHQRQRHHHRRESSFGSISIGLPSHYPAVAGQNRCESFENSLEEELQDFDAIIRSTSETSSTIGMPSRYPSHGSMNHHILHQNNQNNTNISRISSSFGSALVEELRDFDETFLFRRSSCCASDTTVDNTYLSSMTSSSYRLRNDDNDDILQQDDDMEI